MGCSSGRNRRIENNEFIQEAKGFKNKKVKGVNLDLADNGLGQVKQVGTAKGIAFDEELINHADESGVVKPWLENLVCPNYDVTEDLEPPKYKLNIDYIFGYRIQDCRQNLFYFSKDELLYMAGSIAIIQNIDDLSQTLFGGFDSKEEKDCHDDDIMSVSYFQGDVSMVASGQRGLKPLILIWSPVDTSVVYAKFNLPKGTKEVSALEFDKDGHYLCATGKDDLNSIFIFDIRKKELLYTIPTDQVANNELSEYIIDVSASETKAEFCIVGVHKIYFLTMINDNYSLSKNIYQKKGDELIVFTCCTYLEGNKCIVGNDQGEVYFFQDGSNRTLFKKYPIAGGSIQNITFSPQYKNQLYISDSLCNVIIFDSDLGRVSSFSMPSIVKALDVNIEGEIAMGLKDGSIYIKNDNEGRLDLFLSSHCEGSIRGLDFIPQTRAVTTGDDNRIIIWNLRSKKKDNEAFINKPEYLVDPNNPDKKITHPNNKSGAVSYNTENGYIVLGLDNGSISIREGIKALDKRVYPDIVISEPVTDEQGNTKYFPITEVKFTEYGNWLAVTTEAGDIVSIDPNSEFAIIARIKMEDDYITRFDWDTTLYFIQGATIKNKYYIYEFIDTEIKEATKSKIQNLDWPQITCKFGFSVQGIYMGSTDPNFISAACKAHSKKVILSGDDDKFLNLYNYPCLADNPKVKSFKGHSGHIRRIVFTKDDEKILTIADDDKALILWTLVSCD